MPNPKKSPKAVKVNAFAIVTKYGNQLCRWVTDGESQRYNCYDKLMTAKKYLKPYANMKIYKIVPCTIVLEIASTPVKRRKK